MIEFTINLPSEGHARLLVDELRKSYWIETADQIEAQIQPPVPAEPTGDVTVWAGGEAYTPEGVHRRWLGAGGIERDWSFLAQHDPMVYRREPSPEAVEALVQEFAQNLENDLLDISAESRLSEFAARLLGQESAGAALARRGLDEMKARMAAEAEQAIPVERVRQVLRSSPSGYLTNEEVLTAYKDLRKRLAALLPEGAQ
jgi:hypothetical protein